MNASNKAKARAIRRAKAEAQTAANLINKALARAARQNDWNAIGESWPTRSDHPIRPPPRRPPLRPARRRPRGRGSIEG